jgi:P27 family predicted phage terminase small subunit
MRRMQTMRLKKDHEKPKAPTNVIFEPPKYMGEVAREEFLRVQDLLRKQGLLDALDKSLLTDYANMYEEIEELTIRHRALGGDYTTENPAAGTVAHGLYSLLNKQRAEIRKLRQDLGFTVRQRQGNWKTSEGSSGKLSKDDI